MAYEDLARRLNFRPYSELSQFEKEEVAKYLEAFQEKYGKIDMDPSQYWWKQRKGAGVEGEEWMSYNVNSIRTEEAVAFFNGGQQAIRGEGDER